MKPVSPIIPGVELPEVKFAEDQPEYETLPAFIGSDGVVLTRWKLSFSERLRVLFTGDIYLFVWTFRQPLQPVALSVEAPKVTEGSGDAMAGVA